MSTNDASTPDNQAVKDFRALLDVQRAMLQYINAEDHADMDLKQLEELIDHTCTSVSVDTKDTINLLLETIESHIQYIQQRAGIYRDEGLPVTDISHQFMRALSVKVSIHSVQLKYYPDQALEYVTKMMRRIVQA